MPTSSLAKTPGAGNLAMTGAATAATAVLGALATDPESWWYRSLDLPDWQPPAAAFPIVWTALYADIALTSASALDDFEERGEEDQARAYRIALATNLALNLGWSVLFWRSRRPWLAAVEAAALTVSSADLARRAGRHSRRRGAALAPYAVWCGFATVLSGAIARRNRR